MIVVAHRYNSQRAIQMLRLYGSRMTYGKRWQVSLRDEDNNHYDYYFVSKPSRKQIRKLHRK